MAEKLEEVVKKTPAPVVVKKVKTIVLKNTEGKDMKVEDYFYKGVAPETFNQVCGTPVDREDLLEVFHRVFKAKENFLFYKSKNKELYIVVIPLKNSTTVGPESESPEGDFQKHSISFLSEGSVNLDTLKSKLQRIMTFVKFDDR